MMRVNLPGAPQQATLVTDVSAPLEFTVGGWRGWSRRWPPDPTSRLTVHVLDFTAADVRGDARITVGAEESHPFRVAPDVYEGLAADALGFFRRMRCAHPDTAVAAWTGPDAERLYPGWRPTGRFDVSGGWYDAGDYGKYVVSGSLPTWQLLAVAPQECRWQLDWMLRMLVPAGQPLAGMAFHRVHGTEWSPLPGLPHEDPTTRVLHRPSTAATLHVAAVAAAAARTFAGTPYPARLLAAARRAHAAAHRHPRLVAPDDERGSRTRRERAGTGARTGGS
jgi:endoglucanase